MVVSKIIQPEVKDEARRLRLEGLSVGRIAARLGIAKSTTSLLVRDIPLTDTQRSQLEAASAVSPASAGRRLGQLTWSRQCRAHRRGAQLMGRELARLGDPEFAAGCMLYWAEGSKSRNQVALANADPHLVAFFVRWLGHWFGIGPERISLRVNCFLNNGVALGEIEDWWLRKAGLPASCLRRSVINRPSSASKGLRGRLVYGTAHIKVDSTFVIQAIYGAIQEIAGFERPEWLDRGTTVSDTVTS